MEDRCLCRRRRHCSSTVTFATSVSTGSRTSWPPNASTNSGAETSRLSGRSEGRTLPVAAWPLLGRERELAEIRTLVADRARLLTLSGPGGSGKTRLAVQAAAELSEDFHDGTFFVALAPLRNTTAVRSTVAEAVGLQPDDNVAGWLASRRVLLVLDNLEHLQGVAAVVAELVVGEVVVLATSRVPLHLSVERELPVEPLPDKAAAELFVGRAAAAGRHIAVDETVTTVCRRLDNLPLAIELAAARAKLLSPAALLRRLDKALPLLVSGAVDLPERQRTLRATIESSHDLLDPDGHAAFRRLSVFRGSFTLDDAEAITGADLDQFAALLDHSLLKALGDERFFLLETLREYAGERLDEAGETAGLRTPSRPLVPRPAAGELFSPAHIAETGDPCLVRGRGGQPPSDARSPQRRRPDRGRPRGIPSPSLLQGAGCVRGGARAAPSAPRARRPSPSGADGAPRASLRRRDAPGASGRRRGHGSRGTGPRRARDRSPHAGCRRARLPRRPSWRHRRGGSARRASARGGRAARRRDAHLGDRPPRHRSHRRQPHRGGSIGLRAMGSRGPAERAGEPRNDRPRRSGPARPPRPRLRVVARRVRGRADAAPQPRRQALRARDAEGARARVARPGAA